MQEDSVSKISINNKGNLIATANENGTLIRIHNIHGDLLQEFKRGHEKAIIYTICFDKDSKFMAVSSSRGTIHIFSMGSSLKKLKELEKNKNEDNNNNKSNNNENKINNDNQKNKNEKNKKINKNNNKNKDKDKDKHESTNLKYFHQNKEKYQLKYKKTKKLKLIKPKTNSFLMMETKEELEDKISKLKEDYDKLNQKTEAQLEEEFYQYLEIDDANSYRKKMVGYIYPFQNREKPSRFPLQSVAHPVKRDPKMQKEMHKILVQRHEEMKREKELKQMREKNILFEKRKKKFEVENKKIQQKMSLKNDYLQKKKNEEDYQKEKMNKLTWQQIQNCDYDTFIINEKDRKKNNLDDIFTSQSNQFEGDDADYLKNFRLKKGFNEMDENSKMNKNNININVNNINNNNNMFDSVSKTEPFGPKFDSNLSRISSGNNVGNNSEDDIVNSFGTNK